MKLNFKKLSDNATIPTRGSKEAAGYDLYSAGDYDIAPHGTVKISTDIAISIPEGYFGGIFARSGLATKKGLRPANCVGVIDSDYRGNIIVALHNDTGDFQLVDKGERIAQLIIMPYETVEWNEVEDLDETDRGEGGFGSTGEGKEQKFNF